jgi:hypothetical protein
MLLSIFDYVIIQKVTELVGEKYASYAEETGF